jgi:hypothetical protein
MLVANVTWQAMMRTKTGVGDLVQRIRDDQAQLGTRWLDDREVG